MGSLESLNDVFLTHWALLERHSAEPYVWKVLNGHSLDIATVVLVARYMSAVAKHLRSVDLLLDTMLR